MGETQDAPCNAICDAAWADVSDALGLCPRQGEVLRHIVAGRSVKEAARRAGLRTSTAYNHLRRLYARLRVDDKVELIALVHATYRTACARFPSPIGCRKNCHS